jgi:cytochrome c oxidase assembly protein subunit 15
VTGVSTVFLHWPLALAVIHNGGAALLVLLLTMLNFKARIQNETASNRTAARLLSA